MPKRISRPSPAQYQSDQAALEHQYRRFISQAASDQALCVLVDSIDRAVLADALDRCRAWSAWAMRFLSSTIL